MRHIPSVNHAAVEPLRIWYVPSASSWGFQDDSRTDPDSIYPVEFHWTIHKRYVPFFFLLVGVDAQTS